MTNNKMIDTILKNNKNNIRISPDEYKRIFEMMPNKLIIDFYKLPRSSQSYVLNIIEEYLELCLNDKQLHEKIHSQYTHNKIFVIIRNCIDIISDNKKRWKIGPFTNIEENSHMNDNLKDIAKLYYAVDDMNELNELNVKYLDKKGLITELNQLIIDYYEEIHNLIRYGSASQILYGDVKFLKEYIIYITNHQIKNPQYEAEVLKFINRHQFLYAELDKNSLKKVLDYIFDGNCNEESYHDDCMRLYLTDELLKFSQRNQISISDLLEKVEYKFSKTYIESLYQCSEVMGRIESEKYQKILDRVLFPGQLPKFHDSIPTEYYNHLNNHIINGNLENMPHTYLRAILALVFYIDEDLEIVENIYKQKLDFIISYLEEIDSNKYDIVIDTLEYICTNEDIDILKAKFYALNTIKPQLKDISPEIYRFYINLLKNGLDNKKEKAKMIKARSHYFSKHSIAKTYESIEQSSNKKILNEFIAQDETRKKAIKQRYKLVEIANNFDDEILKIIMHNIENCQTIDHMKTIIHYVNSPIFIGMTSEDKKMILKNLPGIEKEINNEKLEITIPDYRYVEEEIKNQSGEMTITDKKTGIKIKLKTK